MTLNLDWLFILTFVAILGCGSIAGVFFAFSTFVMAALGRLTAAEGIRAMQEINLAVVNPVFLGVFLGTALISVVAIIAALLRWQAPGAVYLLIGGVLYMVGSFLVTMLFNVPKNNALAVATPSDLKGINLWANYRTSWTAWNHLRAIASLAAMAFLIIALCQY